MTPVITLTTDFGDVGPYVGVMKAVIRQHAPAAPVYDLTHHVVPCQPGEAGFWLSRCYRYFPAGSVHVAVVDPGVGTARAILACTFDEHIFLAPDNGILPMITGPHARLHVLSEEWFAQQAWPAPSSTFHGRDIFAPLAAAFVTGRAAPADIGPESPCPMPAAMPAPEEAPGTVSGRVVAIDRWGNLITNIDSAILASLPDARVNIGQREISLAVTYGAAPPGALLALINSFGVIEVAWREGNAAQLLGLGHGAPVVVRGAGSCRPIAHSPSPTNRAESRRD